MRFLVLCTALLCSLLVGGCASAVSPLYTKSDLVTDPSVVGTWVNSDKDNPGTVHIEKTQNGSYQVAVHDTKSGDDTVYEAYLVKLGSTSFADLLLTNYRHAGQDINLPAGAVALHEIVKYQVVGGDLSYSIIDPDALKKLAKQPGFPLQFRDTKESGGDTVILSTTEELRRYLSAHPTDILGEAEHLKRQH